MKKFQVSLGKALSQALLYSLKISHIVVAFLKKVFDTKTILLVSKKQIRSYSINPLAQVVCVLVALWFGFGFIKSFRYNLVMKEKSVEISDLKKANQEFEDQVNSLNSNLQKINVYFKSISGYQNPEAEKNSGEKNLDKKIKDLFGDLKLNSDDKQIAAKIADSNLILDDIKSATVKRISDLEQKLAIAGIALSGNKAILKKNDTRDDENQNVVSLNKKEDLTTKQGGPFKELGNSVFSSAKSQIFNFSKEQFSITNEIGYLANLEKFIHFAPLSAPMKNYYVSSIFGKRSDPFRKTLARHEGMDFVGKTGSKILSPSAGKVIFAGKFSSYGNMLMIDHGYGFTTRYGHLSKINVREGDVVAKEQVIATQGSTGRSTGQHLHYEVRYKNIPLNPKKFLQAGQEIFS